MRTAHDSNDIQNIPQSVSLYSDKDQLCAGQLMDISFAANYAQVAVLERGVHLAFPPTLSDLD